MKLPLSVCIIAFNAEKTLQRCLNSIKEVAGEIIFIDTGSEDNTPFIARKAGARVYSLIWKNDFSEARNHALRYVSLPWNLFIDTDEELVIEDREKFAALLKATVTDSYYLAREEILSGKEKAETIRCRLLKTEKNYRYYGKIHETPVINSETSEIVSKAIVYLRHYGYNPDFASPLAKKQRNISILREINQNSNELENRIYLLKELGNENSPEKLNLIAEIDKSVEKCTPSEIQGNIVLVSFFQESVLTNSRLNDTGMIEKYCLEGLKYFPAELTLLSMAGELFFRKKDYDKSLSYYFKIIELVSNDNYLRGTSVHEGVKTYGTYYNIALCYKMKGENHISREFARKALASNPDFIQAGELLNKLAVDK